MSNRRKLPKRRGGVKPVPGPGEVYAYQFGVVANRHVEDDIEDAMTGTHDTLIEVWGEHRRSGIWWTQHFAREAVKVLRDLIPDGDPDVRSRDEMIARLDNPATLLVIAWAVAVEPDGGDPS